MARSRDGRWLEATAALLLACSLAACSPASTCPTEEKLDPEAPPVSADARPDPALADVVGFDEGEQWLTPYFIYGTNLVLPVAVLAWLAGGFALYIRRARRARRSELQAQAATLAPGETILHGTVRDEDGGGPVVRLAVEQAGVQFHRNKKDQTRWTEIDRKLEVRPFELVTPSGSVRVEPDGQALVVDELELRPRDGVTRLRVSEIGDGDDLYASGTLVAVADPTAGGYRGGARGWALRPPSSGRMLLSTESLTSAYAHHAANRLLGLVLFGVLLLGAQLLAVPYHWARVGAQDEAALVTSRCYYVEGQGKKAEHYRYVKYRLLSSGESLESRVGKDDFARLPPGAVMPVNVLRGDDEPRVTIGAGAATNAGVSLVPLIFILVAAVLCPWFILRSRLWWERDKLVDVVDGQLDKQP